jgi:hypothetical protein
LPATVTKNPAANKLQRGGSWRRLKSQPAFARLQGNALSKYATSRQSHCIPAQTRGIVIVALAHGLLAGMAG